VDQKSTIVFYVGVSRNYPLAFKRQCRVSSTWWWCHL